MNWTNKRENFISTLIISSLFIASLGNSLSLFDFNGASGWLQRVGCAGERFEVCFVFLIGKGKSTVVAGSNLGLVGIDEDSRMTERTATAVAGDDSLLGPSHGLFVNQLNGGIWLGLKLHDSLLKSRTSHSHLSRLLTLGPGGCTIGSLQLTILLSFSRFLDDSAIKGTH